MINYFIVPGLGNSGPDHWQTFFEHSANNFQRIVQADWDAPNRNDWIETLEKAISGYDPRTVILIGHSLGCATIAHWATKYQKPIKGALLVAPSDPESSHYTFPAKGFAPVPDQKLNFKTIVVASSDDPWVSLERAEYFAGNWGREFINIGNAGHINVASGHTKWDEGLKILERLS